MWNAWAVGCLGLWLIVTAFLPMTVMDTVIHDLTVGIVIFVAGWSMRSDCPLQGRCSAVLGLWLMAVLLLSGLGYGAARQWNLLVSGLLLTVLGLTALGSLSHPRIGKSRVMHHGRL